MKEAYEETERESEKGIKVYEQRETETEKE